jgi:hypothetical protein
MNNTDYIIFIFMALVLVIGIWLQWLDAQKRNALLEQEAARRGGQVVKGAFLSASKLSLPQRGETLEIFMTPGSRYRPAQTHAQFKPQQLSLSEFRLVENNLFRRLTASTSRDRILTQDEAFDRRYVLIARDNSLLATRIAQGPVRERILRSNFRSLEVKIKPDSFAMTISSIPRDEDEFDNFIETALLIVQYL